MYCVNCGNKLDENAYVCVNCGVLLKKRSEVKAMKEKKDTKFLGIISMAFGIVAIFLSIMLFFYDISSVGMYTEVYERAFYVLNYSIFAILISSMTLILSLIGKRDTYSDVGFVLSLISFFFIITEFVVVIIY